MAGLQLSGLASGFDWKSVVDQLIALQRVPQSQLRTKKTENLGKISSFASLRTRVGELETAAKALTSGSLFSQRTVSLSDSESKWVATSANSGTTGEFTFDVTQVATQSVRTGANSRAAALSDSSDVSGLVVSDLRLAVGVTEGVFSINGAQIEIEDTDTLEEVFEKIDDATGGDVTASYDPNTDRVTLSSSSTITLGSGADTSNFLYALKLYNNNGSSISSSAALGVIRLDETIANSGLDTDITAVDADGNGTFEINGVSISYNVNTDTLRKVMQRISDSTAGVKVSYGASDDRFVMTNKSTGDLGIGVSEDSGGLLAAMGLTTGASVVRGDNAEFTVNGGATIVSASNTLTASAHGITGLTLTVDSEDEQTVTVGADTDSVESGIRTFIQKFNAVQQFVDSQTKVTVNPDGSVVAAQFANNRELTDIARQLRSRVFDAVPGLSGTVTRLESIGIDFSSSSSQLSVQDSAKLKTALTENLTGVTTLFTQASSGISARIQTYVSALTKTNGIIDTQENSLERQNTTLDTQIANLERRLKAERTRLEAGFIRMEEAQSLVQSQLSALQQSLNLSSSSN